MKDLDLAGLAKSFGLLRLPKMPELKAANRESWKDADISVRNPFCTCELCYVNLHLKWIEYAYSDPVQEAKRIAALTEAEKDGAREREQRRAESAKKKKKNCSWSEHTDRKDERDKRKEKKRLKAMWIKAQATAEVETGAVAQMAKRPREGLAGASGNDNDSNEWDELAREEKMAKRLRKGDISQKEFDAEFVDL